MTTRLPLALEELRIATPCTADWDEMSGSDRVRFCGRCEKNVYNLSAMTRAEAEQLVRQREGRTCIRLYRRSDGTVITSDCPVGMRRQRLAARMWASIAGAATSAALVLGLLSGRARADLTVTDGKGQSQKAPPPPPMIMGEPAMPHVEADKPKPKPTAHKPPAKPPVLMGKLAAPSPMMGDVAE
jgi:hypothetical protein